MEYVNYQENYQDPLPNYKIPKKKDADSDTIQSYTTPLNWGPPVTNIDSAGTASNWEQYYNANSDSVVTYNFNAYKRPIEKEVPKNLKTSKRPFLDTCPDLSDSSLPKELTSQFQPLFCKLCQARLFSNSNAMLHYKSKNHDKKIRNFLIQYAERTGEPLHKRAKIVKKEESMEDDDPRNKHCDVCDMDFTSKMHANQHYMGRNHHKALVNKKPPPHCILGEDGKWHRVAKVKDDATGRCGIGLAFAKPEELQPNNKGKFQCTICSVFATSQENLDTHYSGQKHKKMLKKLGGEKEMVVGESFELSKYEKEYENYYNEMLNNICENFKLEYELAYDPLAALSTGSTSDKSQYDAWDPSSEPLGSNSPQIGAWEPIASSQSERKSTSTCRTPSGQYYCQVCNISLNSEIQFLQHLDSKKHLKNKQAMAAIKSSVH